MGERASRAVLTVLVLAALGLASCAGARPADSPRPAVSATVSASPFALASCPRVVRRLGLIAFTAGGRLELVDLAACRVTVVRRSDATQPRFSADRRWLAYTLLVNANPSRPVVIPAVGGPAHSPLGGGIVSWSWAPTGELLYGITNGGALVVATPTGRRRIVATQLAGVFAVSPDGRSVAVNRSTCGSQTPVGELDRINVHTGVRSVVLRQAGRFFTFAGWSPDGRWLLFWSESQCSSSIAADGLPLEAVPATGGRPIPAVRHMLRYADFLSWCGARLIAAAGPTRETQLGSTLVETHPPAWRDRILQNARTLSWVSPACAPSGRLVAAAAGPNTTDAQFGVEHRSIWLLRTNGAAVRQLTTPPARDLSDEAPRFSHDGRWILFVRSKVVAVGQAAISRDTIELVRAGGSESPVPVIDFTSNDFSYYDHFAWPDEIDWSQPR